MSYDALPNILTVEQKIGDSIVWDFKYNELTDLTGFSIEVSAISKLDESILFTINSNNNLENTLITTDKFNLGEFTVIVKDTSSFTQGDYYIDVKHISADNMAKSAKSFVMRLLKRI